MGEGGVCQECRAAGGGGRGGGGEGKGGSSENQVQPVAHIPWSVSQSDCQAEVERTNHNNR